MAEARVERRLAAILSAVVAGYSRLLEAAEEGTLRELKAHRAALIDPEIASHRGRIVKTTGDGALVEFASVVDAVRCAVEIQRGMEARNAAVPAERRIEFRIGINLGDIISDGGDIYGDGVNVAARLEALAPPGGICVGAVVHDQLQGKLDLRFEDLGEQSVKNIARPVRVYRVELGPAAAHSPAPAAGPPRLSIVVLPFVMRGGDPAQDFLADIITEELTTYLSRIPDSFVIARTTAFAYQGKAVDVKQIGRELGVRYVLEGSVQPAGDRVRVNAQLIDAATGAHLWAERFDTARADLLAMQDEIVTRLARTLQIEMSAVDAARLERAQPGNPDAEALALRAEAMFLRYGVSDRRETKDYVSLCEQVLRHDPNNVRATAILALTLAVQAVRRGQSANREADLLRAEQLAANALATDPNYYLAWAARALVLLGRQRPEESIVEAERSLSLNPMFIGTYLGLCSAHIALGQPQKAVEYAETAIRLSPRDPLLFTLHVWLGIGNFMMGHDDQAIESFRRGLAFNPNNAAALAQLAAALALAGQVAAARETLARYLALSPTQTIAQWKAQELSDNPVYLAYCERLYEGLRQAGMAEA